MAYQTSPGITVSEIDLTTVVPAVSTTTGAIAGVFAWGPVNEPILVSSGVVLKRRFGKPVLNLNTETYFTAEGFLSYGASLYVVRTDNTAVKAQPPVGVARNAGFIAKYPGAMGNSLMVATTAVGTAPTPGSILAKVTNGTPEANTIHIAIIDENGEFTGVANGILEVYQDVSITSGAKTADGTNNYWKDVINTRSQYVAIENATDESFSSAISNVAFVSGTDGSSENAVSVGSLTASYDLFANSDELDISLIMQGVARGTDDVELANHLITLCETRMDAIAFVSPAKADVVNAGDNALTNVTTFADKVTSSSYVVIDSGYKYRYDKFNDVYGWVPLNGDIAGLCARTDNDRDPWFSPAGYNRGILQNTIKLAYNPAKADRDELYKVSVNPVITQAGQGTLLFGDKTGLKKASAFDRINVRRLFIVLEKAISRASKTTLFEFNDEFTRAQFKNMIEPFLRDIQGRRGIYDFKVVCDETNNTPEVIDRNEFVGDIYIKPARSINTIALNFVAVRTGIEFEEIVGTR